MIKIGKLFEKYFVNTKWTCSICGNEIFNDKYFCEDCLKRLPFNDSAICLHCGRKTVFEQNYCLSCAEQMTAVHIARSAFVYDKPISGLIKKLKYENHRYLAETFAKYLFEVYLKNDLSADFMTFVPMTEKARKARGFNQSELIAEKLSELNGLEVKPVVEKVKDTDRQAKLNKFERLINLKDAFKVSDKKSVKNKTILVIDDVLTTGATSQIISETLKKAGAFRIKLLTVASVPTEMIFE